MPKEPWIIYLSNKCKILFCNNFYVNYCLFLFSMHFNQPPPLFLYHSLSCQVIKDLLQPFFSPKNPKMLGMFSPIYLYICAAWRSNKIIKNYIDVFSLVISNRSQNFQIVLEKLTFLKLVFCGNTVFLSQIPVCFMKHHFGKLMFL